MAQSGVAIGLLQPSRCRIEDLLRSAFVTDKNFRNSSGVAPFLYWSENGFLICTRRETQLVDDRGFAIAYPYVCYAEMRIYQRELKVPDVRPEVMMPVIRINQPILKDALEATIEQYEEYLKHKGEDEENVD